MKDNDIVILDLDEEVDYTKKIVVVDKAVIDKRRKNNKTKVNQSQVQELKEVSLKKKKNKHLGVGEKIFLVFSILFILGCFVFYGYRTYYYYHLTHDVVKNITIKDKLTSFNNIAYQSDGLHEKNGYFYYKGVNVNNYVYYSGRLFRIIDINNGIRMIEDETITNLIWGIDTKYQDSIIHKWLDNYLKTLKDYELYLNKNKWCNKEIEVENYDCKETIDDYVGLLSVSDYLNAGARNSYLNNNTYFWTINQDQEGNPLYVNSDGTINNIYKKEDNYFSYGIRPVITLKEDISIISGSGTKDNPFIIETLGNALLKDNSIGSFVNYNNKSYRILNIDSDGISLILNGVIDIPKKYDDVLKYLNGEYLQGFKKEDLVINSYDISEYSLNNKYSLNKTNIKKNYIIIPSIGDLFLNKYQDYWLNNYSDNKLGLYYSIDDNNMFFADLKSNTHLIRPIIKLNSETVILGGTGQESDPLIIAEEGDNNVE